LTESQTPLNAFLSLARVTVHCACVVGCCENHGERLGANEALREEVHTDARQHSSSGTENPNPQVKRRDGTGHEGCHKGNDHHE